MKAGNTTYSKLTDLPQSLALFPQEGALLLPMANMSLNIFEPRYLSLVSDVLMGNRMIGIVQPQFAGGGAQFAGGGAQFTGEGAQFTGEGESDNPHLCEVGCMGRLTAFQESGDGSFLINLSGVCRFRIVKEEQPINGYRMAQVVGFEEDLAEHLEQESAVDRDHLLQTFKLFLEANEMEADWEGVSETSTESLVNTLSMMSPYGPAEKQALLEAPDLKTRAETLIAITEVMLARENGNLSHSTLQ